MKKLIILLLFAATITKPYLSIPKTLEITSKQEFEVLLDSIKQIRSTSPYISDADLSRLLATTSRPAFFPPELTAADIATKLDESERICNRELNEYPEIPSPNDVSFYNALYLIEKIFG